MKHPAVTAFALVLLFTAPGTFSELCADGASAPSATRIVKVGDARLSVTLDRTRVKPGEVVQVAMSVQNPGPRDREIELEVAVLERSSEPMARVMPPPRAVHKEKVTMVARARGVTEKTVALKVPPAAGRGRGIGRTLMARVTAVGATSPATIAFVTVPAGRAAPAAAPTLVAPAPRLAPPAQPTARPVPTRHAALVRNAL